MASLRLFTGRYQVNCDACVEDKTVRLGFADSETEALDALRQHARMHPDGNYDELSPSDLWYFDTRKKVTYIPGIRGLI